MFDFTSSQLERYFFSELITSAQEIRMQFCDLNIYVSCKFMCENPTKTPIICPVCKMNWDNGGAELVQVTNQCLV